MTTASTSAPVLEARDVAVHYGGIKAVDGVSFALDGPKIFGLLGPNGSGKSTLLASISRLVDLTSGLLLIDGKEYQRARPSALNRRGVARTFQTVRLCHGLTVRENVMLAADLSRRDRPGGKATTSDVRDAIARVGLAGCEALRPAELSYGMQRRVEIARAIAARPRLLLLDEPTAGMSQSERREISDLLGSLRSEGLTQLLVEHDVQMMVDTCDYIFAMNFGRFIAEGTPHEVVQTAAVREAYLGTRWRNRAAG